MQDWLSACALGSGAKDDVVGMSGISDLAVRAVLGMARVTGKKKRCKTGSPLFVHWSQG